MHSIHDDASLNSIGPVPVGGSTYTRGSYDKFHKKKPKRCLKPQKVSKTCNNEAHRHNVVYSLTAGE